MAIVHSDGSLIASVGDPERLTTLRSSAKPLQAMAALELGTADAFGFGEPEIAIMAGSHSGEPRHTALVASMLSRAGLDPSALECGTHPPFHAVTRAALERAGAEPTTLHHNCSGKHCGMVCTCVHQDWDRRTYFRPDHPLQRVVQAVVVEVSGVAKPDLGIAIDGCGVPTFALPLRSFARAFARLGSPGTLESSHGKAAQRVRDAMIAHPGLVAGEGRLDTAIMELTQGAVVTKSGAEACHGVAVPDRGWGIAVKIEDGGARAISVTVVELLRQLELLTAEQVDQLGALARPVMTNYRDEIVGEGRPLFTLARR